MIHNPENFAKALPGDDSPAGDRLSDLLADRALGGFAIADCKELDRLLSDSDSGDYEAFARIAASLELGLMAQCCRVRWYSSGPFHLLFVTRTMCSLRLWQLQSLPSFLRSRL